MRLISAGSLVRAQSGPVFARGVVENKDCRALASEGGLFGYATIPQRGYDLAGQQETSLRAQRKQYYGEECPAATWVHVQRLYLPKFVIEMELVAVFPKS